MNVNYLKGRLTFYVKVICFMVIASGVFLGKEI